MSSHLLFTVFCANTFRLTFSHESTLLFLLVTECDPSVHQYFTEVLGKFSLITNLKMRQWLIIGLAVNLYIGIYGDTAHVDYISVNNTSGYYFSNLWHILICSMESVHSAVVSTCACERMLWVLVGYIMSDPAYILFEEYQLEASKRTFSVPKARLNRR